MRLSVASVADLSVASSPLHIDFTVKFIHPCWYAVFSDNGGLHSPLDSAITNGPSDSATINPFPFSFPALTGSIFDCSAQTVTVIEPAPAYSSGPVSNFISVSPYNYILENFEVTVASTSEAELEIGSF